MTASSQTPDRDGPDSGPPPRFRRLGGEDIPALARLERECFSTAWQEDQFRASFSQKIFAAFGLEMPDKGLVGYISVYHLAGELEILNIAVLPEFRRNGYGQRLLGMAMNLAREMGLERAVLEVRPSNGPALGLYARNGFTRAGTRPGYYTDTGEDALVLAAPVSNECTVEGAAG